MLADDLTKKFKFSLFALANQNLLHISKALSSRDSQSTRRYHHHRFLLNKTMVLPTKASERLNKKGNKNQPVIVRLFELLPWIVCGVVFFIFVRSMEDDDRYIHHSHADLLDIRIQQPKYQQVNQTKTQPQEGQFLWETKSALPNWMKEFFAWQTQERKSLNHDNWQDHQYLVLRCYKEDEKCGGLSDRLKPVPLLVYAAAKSKRLLFIDWSRPYELQEFLIPPVHGFDWTLPAWLRTNLLGPDLTRQTVTSAAKLIDSAKVEKFQAIFSHLHDTFGGSHQYDEKEGDNAFGIVFHDLFQTLFEPSPPIKQIIKTTMQESGLVSGEYVTAHYRAEYGKEVARHPKLRDPKFLREMAQNAVNCASSLLPGKPIFFASDSSIALNAIIDFKGHTDHPIVMFQRKEASPLHLDRLSNETHPTIPSDYYSTFVDLFLAGSAKCLVFGRGGFGRFASLMSYNASCSKKHTKNFFPDPCKWAN